MRTEPQLTSQTLKVLGALLNTSAEALSGAEIGRVTKLASGTLYPILVRLENARWVKSQWEDGDPHQVGRPRRRLYEITGLGARKARVAIKDMASVMGGLAWMS